MALDFPAKRQSVASRVNIKNGENSSEASRCQSLFTAGNLLNLMLAFVFLSYFCLHLKYATGLSRFLSHHEIPQEQEEQQHVELRVALDDDQAEHKNDNNSDNPLVHAQNSAQVMTKVYQQGKVGEYITQPTKPTKVSLQSHQALFLHVGKAGGGTFLAHTLRGWQIAIQECHPNPCHSPTRTAEATSDKTQFIITLRDPTDRYLSAFYWRSKIVCNRFKGQHFVQGSGKCSRANSALEEDTIFRASIGTGRSVVFIERD